MPRVLLLLTAALGVLAGCRSSTDYVLGNVHEPPPSIEHLPRLRVLGVAQDGGAPHAGCSCENCELFARTRRPRHVASLAIILPPEDNHPAERVYLIDATPDVTAQVRMLADVRDAPAGRVDRAPVDGVFLTHAHVGHYTGLMHFGFESMHTSQIPVWCTPKMGGFLRDNAPWSQLVALDNIDVRALSPGDPVALGSVTVTPIEVPHRNEFADTVGYVIAGPSRTVLYIPDTEPWERWPESLGSLERILETHNVDAALLDATFYSLDELPGRHIAGIGHPLIVSTMDRLQPRSDAGLDVRFIHLNHSNPALNPGSDARKEIRRRGFRVAHERSEIGL